MRWKEASRCFVAEHCRAGNRSRDLGGNGGLFSMRPRALAHERRVDGTGVAGLPESGRLLRGVSCVAVLVPQFTSRTPSRSVLGLYAFRSASRAVVANLPQSAFRVRRPVFGFDRGPMLSVRVWVDAAEQAESMAADKQEAQPAGWLK